MDVYRIEIGPAYLALSKITIHVLATSAAQAVEGGQRWIGEGGSPEATQYEYNVISATRVLHIDRLAP